MLRPRHAARTNCLLCSRRLVRNFLVRMVHGLSPMVATCAGNWMPGAHTTSPPRSEKRVRTGEAGTVLSSLGRAPSGCRPRRHLPSPPCAGPETVRGFLSLPSPRPRSRPSLCLLPHQTADRPDSRTPLVRHPDTEPRKMTKAEVEAEVVEVRPHGAPPATAAVWGLEPPCCDWRPRVLMPALLPLCCAGGGGRGGLRRQQR